MLSKKHKMLLLLADDGMLNVRTARQVYASYSFKDALEFLKGLELIKFDLSQPGHFQITDKGCSWLYDH